MPESRQRAQQRTRRRKSPEVDRKYQKLQAWRAADVALCEELLEAFRRDSLTAYRPTVRTFGTERGIALARKKPSPTSTLKVPVVGKKRQSTQGVPTPIRKGRCFVISPIGEHGTDVRKHADRVLKDIIRPALSAVAYHPERIDQSSATGSITAEIVECIHASHMCVAVLTGLNPNVMYELGVRHAWDLPVVVLAEKGTPLPFDIKDFNTLFYTIRSQAAVRAAVEELTNRVTAIIAKLERTESREPVRMLAPFADAMQALGNRYSLEPLFLAKETALRFLSSQLQRLHGELEKDFESGNVVARPLSVLSETLAREFDDFAAKVSVFRSTVEQSKHNGKPRPQCDSVLRHMKALQRSGWQVKKKWTAAQGSRRDFKNAMNDINQLISTCQDVLDHCRGN